MTPVFKASGRTSGAVALTALLAVIIAVLTLMPMPQGGLPGSDKFYHVVAFAALAVPLTIAVRGLAVWVFIGVTAYGGAIELIQPTFHRMGDWADLRADAIGAALGILVGAAVGRFLFGPRRR